MHILLINVPSRSGTGGKCLPLGLLYVGGIIERTGHSAHIVDPYINNPDITEFDQGNFSDIDEVIDMSHPEIIGFGGIGSSYGRTKILSEYLHKKYPAIFQIAGGPLSSLYELLLTKTHVSLIFHGETEITFPLFLEKFEKQTNWKQIPGISYHDGNSIVRNPLAPQIENLDEIPLPAYHLINVKDYLGSISGIIDAYPDDRGKNFDAESAAQKIKSGGKLLIMITSRGCTNKCSFCYRHMKGYRQHSVPFVINHIKFLKSHYGIRGFEFGDELFNFKKDWVLEFCNAIEHENLDIYYRILGARVDRIDREVLQRLKDTGCVSITYGQESGSDTILKEYKKGVTAGKNAEITHLTKEVGLISPIQIVIGSPGETPKTINETIQFLKDNDAGNPSINYFIPFPETPIWEYVTENNLIPDLENYLDVVADLGGATPIVNLTHVPDRVWRSWYSKILLEVKLHGYRRKGKLFHYIISYPAIKLFNIVNPFIPRKVIKSLKNTFST
jgi:anaerobic magnesium-protoporphyrin IX monomethyl ester cyclase